jgi:hypothetical protein
MTIITLRSHSFSRHIVTLAVVVMLAAWGETGRLVEWSNPTRSSAAAPNK